MSYLERAVFISSQAHSGKKDKAGAHYILHPLRVMLKMSSEQEMTVAVLHDVVEDSDWTFEKLREEGFSDHIINALQCVTKKDNETYEEFIARAAENDIARKVKIADLEDNMNIQRIDNLHSDDIERIIKYHKAWKFLTDDTK